MRIYRHVKTGGLYEFICYAKHESTGEVMAIYKSLETGYKWARPESEFNDGRFELVNEK